jgi:hypothetical protein
MTTNSHNKSYKIELMDYTTYLIGNIIFIALLYWVVKNKNNW